MKQMKHMRALTCSLALCLTASVALAQQPCRMEISISGAAGKMIYLANYYGNQLFYTDSAVADAQGLAVFARKSGYKPGLYAVLPGKGRIELVVGEPLVKLATEASDPAGKLRVLESRENTIHHVERKAAAALPEPERTTRLMELARANPGTFAAALILMELEPAKQEVRGPDGIVDSTATADRYRAHYWDNTDLTDARIVNAPVFQNRLEALLAIGLPQQPEPIVAYLDSLIARAGKAEDVKRFIVSLTTKKYADQPTQGLGAVCVRMAQRYVCTVPPGTPAPDWKPEDNWRKVCLKAARKATLLVGAKTRDLVLADTTGKKWISMHAMPQSCVAVVFWSPHCSHCKVAMPLLYEKYVNELKALDVGVYAVAETTDSAHFNDWKAFIKENKLDWVNVGVPWPAYTDWKRDPAKLEGGPTNRESLNYAETWEVTGTPRFYVLDSERRVVDQPGTLNDLISVIKDHQAKAH
jgi:thiol-disulfide isomerase/thioredoxin